MKIYETANEYVLFIHGDAWSIDGDGEGYHYVCRQKTLSSPSNWQPPAKLLGYSDVPPYIVSAINTIREIEYNKDGITD